MRELPELVEYIRRLCREGDKKTSLTKLEEQLGWANGAIGRWAKGRRYPAHDKLKCIADYFEISVDELVGQKETPRQDTGAIGPNKRALYDAIDRMTDAELNLLLERAEKILNSR